MMLKTLRTHVAAGTGELSDTWYSNCCMERVRFPVSMELSDCQLLDIGCIVNTFPHYRRWLYICSGVGQSSIAQAVQVFIW